MTRAMKKRQPSRSRIQMGESVRSMRVELGISLAELSERSGVSSAMLSEIERNRKSPTIRVACQIADALSVPLSTLIRSEPVADLMVVAPDARKTLIDPETGVKRQVLSELFLRHGIEVVQYEVPPLTHTGLFPAHRANTFENITLLSGRIVLMVGAQAVELRTGDSISYEATAPHAFENRHRKPATLMLIIDSSHVRRDA